MIGRAALITLVLVMAACTGASTPQSSGTTVTLTASWAHGYASLAELHADADAVILGNVLRTAYQGLDPQDETLPLTRYDIVVDDTLKGDTTQVIVVPQTGGPMGGGVAVVEGDPLMKEGDRFVMYLRRVASGPAKGQYFVLGGPQGRLAVQTDGTLTKVGDTGVAIPDGLTLEALKQTL